MSRLYVFVAQRFLSVLPLAALFTGLLLATVAFFTARRLARGFGAPIAELAGWTERIARGEALPPEGEGSSGVEELATLRLALRRMADQLETARRQELENVRMRSWTNLARKGKQAGSCWRRSGVSTKWPGPSPNMGGYPRARVRRSTWWSSWPGWRPNTEAMRFP